MDHQDHRRTPAQVRNEADLAAYYDNEVQARVDRDLSPERVAWRAAYIELLRTEGLTSILEIGSGPGRDGQAFAATGLTYTGVDIAPRSVAMCRKLGLDAQVASVFDLPFDDRSFDARMDDEHAPSCR
ncbi:methyltransferase family protein [Kribbella sp. VKM Ac-2571]|uniref:class I SAM-dependent methyltransferase n=1 Tax=Kribbella sp. VKM Ac-2571 TaxID=2512222 RepID=UPI00105FDB6C|nr:class I SAM-dependent methyltransferase [Kribbella sp. VKM Ac-2571]TDO58258.1 methyltransferase family protein [Kribbella sp. VKM Ac-2571]